MVRHNARKCEDLVSDHGVVASKMVAAADARTAHTAALRRRADRRALALAVDARYWRCDRGELGPHGAPARGAANPVGDAYFEVRIGFDAEQVHRDEPLAQLRR